MDAEALAADFGQNSEYRFIGDVVADEYGYPAREGRMGHQLADGLSFVDARALYFKYCLAKKQFGWLAWKSRATASDMPAKTFCQLRSFSIVQSE